MKIAACNARHPAVIISESVFVLNTILRLANIIAISIWFSATPSIAAQTWNIQTVDSIGNVGYYTSLALSRSDQPCISYYDSTNQMVKYAYWDGSNWQKQNVGYSESGISSCQTSMALDNADNPCICYESHYNIEYASWNGSAWITEFVGYGDAPSMVLDNSSNPNICWNYDNGVNYAY